MKVTLKKSKRYQGYRIGIDPADESLIVENAQGKQVAHWVMEDFLDRLGAAVHGFKRQYPRLGLGVHVKYFDPEGRICEGIASTIGGVAYSLNSSTPCPRGVRPAWSFPFPPRETSLRPKPRWHGFGKISCKNSPFRYGP